MMYFFGRCFILNFINLSSGQGLQHLEHLYEFIFYIHFIFPNLGRLGLFYGNKTSSQFAAWRTTLHLPGELTDNILFNATCVNDCFAAARHYHYEMEYISTFPFPLVCF